MRRSVLICCIIAVVLLSAGIAFLVLWEEPEDTVELPPVDLAQRADLISESREDVISVTFSPKDGEEFTILHDAENGSFELDVVDPIFPASQQSLRSVFSQATSLTNLTVVTEDADDEQINMFGLNDPDMVVQVVRYDGVTIDFEIGDIQVVGTGRFARLSGSREVLLLSESQGNVLTMAVEYLYDITFFPFWEYHNEESAIMSIENIIIENEHGTIEIRRRTMEEAMDLPLGSGIFQIVQPVAAEANEGVVRRIILEDLLRIRPSTIESVRPGDLSVYGLNAPVRLTIEADDWHGGTLLIGNANHDRGGRYVMIDGYDAVLFDYFGEYEFLTTRFSRLRSGLMWLHSITDIAAVDFVIEGTRRTLRFEHHEDNELDAWLDNVEISEANARRLYTAALMISPSGETDEPVPTGATPAFSIVMSFMDDSVDILDLYQLNDSQFLIVMQGESTGLFITRMSLQESLISRFETLDRGEDL